MASVSGKAAFVTGASSGIGEAIAVALAAQGALVTLVARDPDRLRQVANRIEASGGHAIALPLDLREHDKISGAFDEAHRRWGRLDILVNAAGVGGVSPLTSGSVAFWREMLEVNVLAVAVATREALRRFPPDIGGYILNVGSTSGHRVPQDGGFYAATKFALRALTEVTRNELHSLRSLTRVSCISPGRVRTRLFSRGIAGESSRSLERDAELAPDQVAGFVVQMLESSPDIEINDVILKSRATSR